MFLGIPTHPDRVGRRAGAMGRVRPAARCHLQPCPTAGHTGVVRVGRAGSRAMGHTVLQRRWRGRAGQGADGMHVCTYLHALHACTRTHTHTHARACMHTHAHARVRTHTPACTRTHPSARTCTRLHAPACKRTRARGERGRAERKDSIHTLKEKKEIHREHEASGELPCP